MFQDMVDILKSLSTLLLSSLPGDSTELISKQSNRSVVKVQKLSANSSLEDISSHLGSVKFLQPNDRIEEAATVKVKQKPCCPYSVYFVHLHQFQLLKDTYISIQFALYNLHNTRANICILLLIDLIF